MFIIVNILWLETVFVWFLIKFDVYDNDPGKVFRVKFSVRQSLVN